MKILLAVVPQSDVTSHPLLAVPTLAGYLAKSGFEDVHQRDFAVERQAQIDQFSVDVRASSGSGGCADSARERGLGKAGADLASDVENR